MSIQNVSFTGGSIPAKSSIKIGPEVKNYIAQQAAQKELLAALPKTVQTLSKMKKVLGNEAINICINSLGTGLIAPLFIKYNFLSKTDKDTRTYSAWRQPVSAVLAVVTQAGILIPINRWMNKLSNEGKLLGFDMYNQGGYQNKEYLTKRIKKANPNATKDEIEKLVSAEQHRQMQGLVDSVKSKNTISFVDKKGKTVTMKQDKFNEMVSKVLDDKIDDYNKNIKRYTGEKLASQKSGLLYKYEHTDEAKDFLNKAQAKANELGDKKQDEMLKWLKAQIKEMKANKKSEELIKMASDISKRPDMDTIKGKIANDLDKTDKVSKLASKEEVEKFADKKMEKAVKTAEEDIKTLTGIKDQMAKEKTVKEILDGLPKGHPLKESFVMDIVQKYTENIGKNLKGWSAISGLVISFAMLPVSCDLLNRLYPVFMDTFFPGLSKKKKAAPPKDNTNSDVAQVNSNKTEEVAK